MSWTINSKTKLERRWALKTAHGFTQILGRGETRARARAVANYRNKMGEPLKKTDSNYERVVPIYLVQP